MGLGQQASLVLRCGKLSLVVLAVFVFSLVYGLAGKKKRLSLRFCAHVALLISTRVSAHPFGATFAAHKKRFNAWPIVHHDPRLAQPLFTTVGIRGSDSFDHEILIFIMVIDAWTTNGRAHGELAGCESGNEAEALG